MSAAAKPRLTAALEVTFSVAQCRREPAFSRGYTMDTPWIISTRVILKPALWWGWAWPVAEGLPHPTRSHKTPFQAAEKPSGLHCGTHNLFAASKKWRRDTCGKLSSPLPSDQRPSGQRLPASLFVVPQDERRGCRSHNNRHKAVG